MESFGFVLAGVLIVLGLTVFFLGSREMDRRYEEGRMTDRARMDLEEAIERSRNVPPPSV